VTGGRDTKQPGHAQRPVPVYPASTAFERSFVRRRPCVERYAASSAWTFRSAEMEVWKAPTLEGRPTATHAGLLHAQDAPAGPGGTPSDAEGLDRRPAAGRRQGPAALKLWVERAAAGSPAGSRCLQVADWLRAGLVLASGGGGTVRENHQRATQAHGDGWAMAWQAGAQVRDLESFQFPPEPPLMARRRAPHFPDL